jgi:RNA polymerase sigma-70 factor (ECF subfamily)
LIDPRPPTDEALTAQETLLHVTRLLDSIEPRSREAFLLHRVDGLTYTQIARQLGVSVSSIEKHIAWAMAVLMDSVERNETPP